MSGETYRPQENVLMFGVILVDGFAPNTAIKLTRRGTGTDVVVGIGGEWAFQEDADGSAMIEVILMSTASANAALNAHMKAGNLPVTLMLSNLSIGESEMAWKAKIVKQPDREYGKEVPQRTWKFICGESTVVT